MDAAALRAIVLDCLTNAGFVMGEDGRLYPPSTEKDVLRRLHAPSVHIERARRQPWIRRNLDRLLTFFADGDDVDPFRIDPVLEEAVTEQQHALFRMARLLWSLPYAQGCGRRLRFLIRDASNGKLIAIIGLQSPPLDFPVRDRLFRYPSGAKTRLVNQTMDIQTLGAVPPYHRLLGGKLAVYLAASNEVRQIFQRKYANRATCIEQRVLPPHLVALTTTSAFGRSSMYHRVQFRGRLIAESIGYTEGYGTFHLMEIYPILRAFLESQGRSTHGGLHLGPRRKWQIITCALNRLGVPGELLHHGVKREAFLVRLIDNLEDYMEGRDAEPHPRDLPLADLVDWWRKRWLLPRAERVQDWRDWRREAIRRQLLDAADHD